MHLLVATTRLWVIPRVPYRWEMSSMSMSVDQFSVPVTRDHKPCMQVASFCMSGSVNLASNFCHYYSPLVSFKSCVLSWFRVLVILIVWLSKRMCIDEFRMVLGGQPTPCFFFYNRIREKHFFTLPVVNDNEIVRSTSDWVEGKTGLICLVRYIWNCWCRRVLQFLVTLDNG